MKGFTELKDYPNYYIAHTPPRLMRIKQGVMYVCSQTPNSAKDNYWTCTLKTPEGKYVKRSMHRLLMETFVPNPEHKAHVNHIDGDKSNNDLSNLEWATPKENAQHAVRTGLKDTQASAKPVYQYTLDGGYVDCYSSAREAGNTTGIAYQNIGKAALGERIHAGYFRWSFSKENLEPLTRKYVKGYEFKGNFYKTLAGVSSELGLTHKDSSFKQLSKLAGDTITKLYYK